MNNLFKFEQKNFLFQMNTTNFFTLIIPGQPCVTAFEQIGDNLLYDLVNPGAVSTIGFALNCQLPEGFAASLYYSLPPFADLQFLGLSLKSLALNIYSILLKVQSQTPGQAIFFILVLVLSLMSAPNQ